MIDQTHVLPPPRGVAAARATVLSLLQWYRCCMLIGCCMVLLLHGVAAPWCHYTMVSVLHVDWLLHGIAAAAAAWCCCCMVLLLHGVAATWCRCCMVIGCCMVPLLPVVSLPMFQRLGFDTLLPLAP